jgi:hypothetical protein
VGLSAVRDECAQDFSAIRSTLEEIDERDPEFIRKETEAAVKRTYDQLAKDEASFVTSGQDLSRLGYELPLWKEDLTDEEKLRS